MELIKRRAGECIRPHVFRSAFLRTCTNQKEIYRLGLALSGGVDSMALAYLCHSLKLKLPDRKGKWVVDFKLFPFIVDHKARKGSTEEAELVSDRLQRLLGVEPTILTLQWPEGIKPSELTDFESEARRLRYQALGRACSQHGVQSLLLAHHADDQAETVLTRLASGHRALGLQAMQPSADIPECWGIPGIYRSEEFNKNQHNLLKEATKVLKAKKPIELNSKGITIYRPLLQFTKDDLIATCQANDITWVEDESNQDPTVTIRNVARKLLATDDLPRALQKPSLLNVARSSVDRMKDRQWCADCLLRTTDFLSLDFRAGKLSVHIPNPAPYLSWYGDNVTVTDVQMRMNHRLEVGMYLRRLMEVVSPLETIPLTGLQTAVDAISDCEKTPHAFAICGVKFTPSLERVSTDYFHRIWEIHNQSASKDRKALARKVLDGGQSYVWTLTRVPYYSTISLPIIPVPPLLTMASSQETPFQLWDGRFWIRVRTQLPGLCIRPLREADMKSFKGALRRRTAFEKLIKDAAPDSSRWSLPAIAVCDEQPVEEGESRVLALPTLDVCLPKYKDKLSYAVRYKKIDLSVVLEPTGKVFMESLDRYSPAISRDSQPKVVPTGLAGLWANRTYRASPE